jgi:large subunit ribosomal protein L5
MRIRGMIPEFKTLYGEKIVPYLKRKFNISNDLAVPKLQKVVVNIGFGTNEKVSVQRAADIVKLISGQNSKITRAQKDIASFKMRKGKEIGAFATCRGDTMYAVLQRIFYAMLEHYNKCPLWETRSIVRHHNKCSITIGFKGATIFDGIVPASAEESVGCSITIVGLSKSEMQFAYLLMSFGFPFKDIKYKYNIWEAE